MTVRRIAALLGLVIVSSPAWAGDGVLEINQACVAAGCFVGDGAGFPVTITASGSYRLTSNLVVPDANTSGIQFAVGGVSLDLGGFAIQGPTQCTGEPVTSCTPIGSGVGVSGEQRAHIHDGRVEGMGNIGIAAGGDARVWDVSVSNNGGIGINLSRGDSVRNSTVTFNGSSGIVGASGGGFGEVAGCTVRGNKLAGTQLTSGLVVDSRFQNNGTLGIGGSPAYKGNVVTGNTTPGVPSGDAIGCNAIDGTAVCPP